MGEVLQRLLWPASLHLGNKITWWLMIVPYRGSEHPNQTTIGELNGPLTWKPRVGWLLIRKLKGLRKDNGSTASTASAKPCRFSATREWKDRKDRLFYLQTINSQHTRCFALVLGKGPISEMLLAIHDSILIFFAFRLCQFILSTVNCHVTLRFGARFGARFGVLKEGETRSAPRVVAVAQLLGRSRPNRGPTEAPEAPATDPEDPCAWHLKSVERCGRCGRWLSHVPPTDTDSQNHSNTFQICVWQKKGQVGMFMFISCSQCSQCSPALCSRM